jgi:hypothetical protein
MYIYQTGAFLQPTNDQRTSLKEHLKAANCSRSLRRAGRFNQLAVLGAKACCSGLDSLSECNLIITTVNGPIANTGILLESVIQQQQLPMPFNFMNSQNNSACFYVAQALAIRGSSLVCLHSNAPIESAMMLAKIQWAGANNRPVLIGHVDEWTLPSYRHPTGYDIERQALSMEGSSWFLLSNKPMTTQPIARVLELALSISADKVLTALNQHNCYIDSVTWDLDQASKELLTSMIKSTDSLSINTHSPLESTEQFSRRLNESKQRFYCRLHQTSGNFNFVLLKRNVA